jgi:hypothetical protein
MNTPDINKLKKAELVELSHKLQNERSELTGTVVTLRESETELRGRIEGFEVERSELLAEKELLHKKYGQYTLSNVHMTLHPTEKRQKKPNGFFERAKTRQRKRTSASRSQRAK